MSHSEDYKRGYAKGYNTGRGEKSKEEMRHWTEMQEVAKRAERAEKCAGMGHCEDCKFWNRGDGRRELTQCQWGACEAGWKPGGASGTWAAFDDVPRKVTTSSRFGCVLFAARIEDGAREIP